MFCIDTDGAGTWETAKQIQGVAIAFLKITYQKVIWTVSTHLIYIPNLTWCYPIHFTLTCVYLHKAKGQPHASHTGAPSTTPQSAPVQQVSASTLLTQPSKAATTILGLRGCSYGQTIFWSSQWSHLDARLKENIRSYSRKWRMNGNYWQKWLQPWISNYNWCKKAVGTIGNSGSGVWTPNKSELE